jgi:hypothetical protein
MDLTQLRAVIAIDTGDFESKMASVSQKSKETADALSQVGEHATEAGEHVRGFGEEVEKGFEFGSGLELAREGFEHLKEAIDEAAEATLGFVTETQQWAIVFDKINGAGTGEAMVANARELAVEWGLVPEKILTATKSLEAFGLGGEENLRMVADAAAGSRNELDSVAQRIGLVYANIQEGLPIARYALALERANVISAETVGKLKEMEAAGASGSAKWAVITADLQHFSGAADEMATTLPLATQRIKNAIEDDIGTAFTPIGEIATEAMNKLAEAVTSPGVEDAVLSFAADMAVAVNLARSAWDELAPGVEAAIGEVIPIVGQLGDLAGPAAEWGLKMLTAYTEGLALGEEALVTVMEDIVGIVEWFLQAFSPPKSMPWLRDSGRKTLEEWLAGVGDADLKVFDSVAKQVQTEIESAFTNAGADAKDPAILDAIIGSRGALAEATNEFERTGQVSEDAFNKLRDAAGPAGDSVVEYTRAVFDLTQAENEEAAAKQAQIDLTRQYDAQLRPLQEKQKELALEEKKASDAKAAADDAKKVKEGKESPAEAAMRAEKRALDEQIAAIELAKTKDVDAAKATEDAAHTKVDALKEVVNRHVDYNKILDENTKLIDSFTKSTGGAGGAAKAMGGNIKEAGETIPPVSAKLEELHKKIDDASASFKKWSEDMGPETDQMLIALKNVDIGFGNVKQAIQDVQSAWNGLKTAFGSKPIAPIPDANQPPANPSVIPDTPFQGVPLPNTVPLGPFLPPVPGVGARASGGPVRAGQMYLVGEEGPEPFIPSVDGFILPTSTTGLLTGSTSTAGGAGAFGNGIQSFRDTKIGGGQNLQLGDIHVHVHAGADGKISIPDFANAVADFGQQVTAMASKALDPHLDYITEGVLDRFAKLAAG